MASINLTQASRLQSNLAAQTQPISAVTLANAVTMVSLVGYLICAAVVLVAPDLLMWLIQSWFHYLTLDPLRPTGPWFRPIEFVVGFVTLGGTVWLGAWTTARLYNAWTTR